jgi:8-amino-7-oxononanoate synthase
VNLDDLLAARLAELERAHLRRTLTVQVDASQLLNFAANDYLGLSRHPALIEAAREASGRRAGAGASRLVGGTDEAVMKFEAALAEWKQKEAALVFTSGYAAALGTIPALVGRGDTVILDKLAHASLIDAARLSGAQVRVFPHNRVSRLEELLEKLSSGPGKRLVVTESIFYMDGDTAPLREIVELKERHGAWLLVDEAHATGLYGETGAGLVADLGLSGRVEIILSTQSKALGSIGGAISGSRQLIDWLVNRARSFIYSTALPPGAIAASHAAVELVRGPKGARLRAKLRSNVDRFRSGLPEAWPALPSAHGAIQPLLCGESAAALAVSSRLREKGFFIPAIRYPTVGRLGARLRVTLSAAHATEEIDALHAALATTTPQWPQ